MPHTRVKLPKLTSMNNARVVGPDTQRRRHQYNLKRIYEMLLGLRGTPPRQLEQTVDT